MHPQLPELLKLAQESGADLFSVKTLRPDNYRMILKLKCRNQWIRFWRK